MSRRDDELNELTDLLELIDRDGEIHDLDQQSPQFGTGELLLKLMKAFDALREQADITTSGDIVNKNWTTDE
jgi:hypothetical protein